MQLVKKQRQGKCSAMRCKEEATEQVEEYWFCAKHAQIMQREKEQPEQQEETEEIVKRETQEAEAVLEQVTAFAIETKEDLEFAAEVLAEAKGHLNKLYEKEKEITNPLNAALKAARDLFRKPKVFYAQVEGLLKQKIGLFHLEEKERNEKAMLEASAAHVDGDDAAKTEALTKMCRVEDVEGVSVIITYDYEILNESLLPREYLCPNHAELKKAASFFGKGQIESVPGVRFFEKPVVRSRAV